MSEALILCSPRAGEPYPSGSQNLHLSARELAAAVVRCLGAMGLVGMGGGLGIMWRLLVQEL